MQPDVQAFHDLDAVARAAGGTLDRAAQASLFNRLDWYRLTLAHCPPPGRPLILHAGGTWLFLMQDGAKIRPMGSWYTLRFTPISPHDAALEAMARWLRARAAHVQLYPMPSAPAEAFRRAGWLVDTAQTTVNRRTFPVDWPGWWAARPARLRETVRRKGRGDPFRLVILDRFDAAAWADYEIVYARSWKPAEGSPAFLRALAAQEGAAGTLRLGLAYDGARAVAAQFWLVEGGHATIHKLAHDEADRARSPGTLLSHALFRHVIERDRVHIIDFGTGDEPYKADWMEAARPLFRLDAWNPRRAAGLTGWARHRAGKLVRGVTNR